MIYMASEDGINGDREQHERVHQYCQEHNEKG